MKFAFILAEKALYPITVLCHLLGVSRSGIHAWRARPARLMRENGLEARRKRRFRKTTDSNHPHPIAPNVVARDFEATAPNKTWVTDPDTREQVGAQDHERNDTSHWITALALLATGLTVPRIVVDVAVNVARHAGHRWALRGLA